MLLKKINLYILLLCILYIKCTYPFYEGIDVSVYNCQCQNYTCQHHNIHSDITVWGNTLYKIWMFLDLIQSLQVGISHDEPSYQAALKDTVQILHDITLFDKESLASHLQDLEAILNITTMIQNHPSVEYHITMKQILSLIKAQLKKHILLAQEKKSCLITSSANT